MRIVFFGTPEFAAPALRALTADPAFDIALVVSQGGKGTSPVEQVARELELPAYRPESLRDAAAREPLRAARPDLFVVAAFGLIFGQRTLEIPRLGAINIHPSILPRYRGASPIMAAIHDGLTETGVSLMVMDTGIDTGAVVSTETLSIAPDDTAESLGAKLASLSATQAARDIPRWAQGELHPRPQQGAASLTRTLSKADGWIDWRGGAEEIERHVRAMWPWPRAWTTVDGAPFQIHSATVVNLERGRIAPGNVIPARKQILVACGAGALELGVVEPAGRRAMSATSFLSGRREPITRLGASGAPQSQPPLIVPIPT